MKRLVMVVCVALAAMWSFSAVANSRVGVVNMQKLIQHSPQVKQLGEQIKAKFATRRTKMIAMSKQLQKNIVKYQKNKAVMSAAQLAALKAAITTQETQLRTAQVQLQQALFHAQNTAMTKFVAKLRAIVKSIASEKKLDMVLPSNTVLYSDNSLDITADVEQRLK